MTIRVFIADDHTVVRDGLRAFLEKNQAIKVVGDAGTGRQTVSQVQSLQPDVVVMDISMPELSGVETARKILEVSSHTRVIILSILGTPEHIFRALQVGVRGYLLKESAGRELMDAVLAVHAGTFYLSPPVIETLIADYLQHRGQVGEKEEDPLKPLSQREREVLHWVVEGKTSAEIAEILCLSPKTVESYRSRMMRKLDVPNLPSLIKFAIQKGLVS
jgi:DNA-binding NarL/FixJ family response regulator